MKGRIIRIALALAGNAIGLFVTSLVLDGFDIDLLSFIVAVVIFTVLTVVIEPLVNRVAERNAPALQGGSALITTFLALLITDLLSDALSVDGIGTWIVATVIVWIATIIAGVLLARFVVDQEATA